MDPFGPDLHGPGADGGSGGGVPAGWWADLSDRVLDRVPPGLTGIRLALGRSWWLPVLVAVAALAVAVAALRFGSPGAAVAAPVASPRPSAPGTARPTGSVSPTTRPSTAPAVAGASSPAAATATVGAIAATSGAPAVVVVDVVGRVRRPGLVRLPAGSRVADAITASGGATPGTDLTPVNLASLVADGQQLRIGLGSPWVVDAGGAPDGGGTDTTGTGGTGGAGGTGSTGSGTTTGKGAPGAGAATASATAPVDLNTATAEQLETLPGVGPATAGRILDWRAQHGRFGSIDDLDDVSGIGPMRLAELRPLVRV